MDKEKLVEKDRRSHYRLSPEAEILCDIEGMGVVRVVGLGASGAGMRIWTDRELPAEGTFPVRLSTGGEGDLLLTARAVWQKDLDFGYCRRHTAGIEFLDLEDAARSRLAALLPPPDQRTEATDDAS